MAEQCERRYLIERAHVALVPGDAFGAPKCLRISYAASLETIAEALDRIEKYLAALHAPAVAPAAASDAP